MWKFFVERFILDVKRYKMVQSSSHVQPDIDILFGYLTARRGNWIWKSSPLSQYL